MVNDASAKKLRNYCFRGKGYKFRADYGGRRCYKS